MNKLIFISKRSLRNLRDFIQYFFLENKIGSPDNHYYKVSRIKSISKKNNCETLIETGTFYGQTIQKCNGFFGKIISVELHPYLFECNRIVFSSNSNIKIYHGDSSTFLSKMIDDAEGKIVYWLDGHYSGNGTACGENASPILNELRIIKGKGRKSDVILIDDIRLFVDKDGYPSLEDTIEAILEINREYKISFDRDCLVAEL